ncbi:hypothetical protein GCM10009838_03950 [Catenulispora subtropica]|uniref:Uncharacterized protein n=1 Tax=Catenulispora subtropica TaxID=450798 RepID=A0ABN2QHN9_9ACTN
MFLELAAAAGLPTVAEAFAERAYTPRGTLVPRSTPGAVLSFPEEVAARTVEMGGIRHRDRDRRKRGARRRGVVVRARGLALSGGGGGGGGVGAGGGAGAGWGAG